MENSGVRHIVNTSYGPIVKIEGERGDVAYQGFGEVEIEGVKQVVYSDLKMSKYLIHNSYGDLCNSITISGLMRAPDGSYKKDAYNFYHDVNDNNFLSDNELVKRLKGLEESFNSALAKIESSKEVNEI